MGRIPLNLLRTLKAILVGPRVRAGEMTWL